MLHDTVVRSTILMGLSLKSRPAYSSTIREARVRNPNQPVQRHTQENAVRTLPYSDLIATAGSS